MKEKKIKKDKKDNKRKDDHKKPHHKKQLSGIYNKKKSSGKQKNKHIESTVEQLVMQAQQAEQLVEEPVVAPVVEPVIETVVEPVVQPSVASEAVLEQVEEVQNENAPVVEEEHVEQKAAKQKAAKQKAAKQPKPKAPKQPRKPMPKVLKLLIQTVLAALFVVLGAALLIGTFMFVYSPVKANNDILADQRLENRMELSILIAEVAPGMNVGDQLSDVIMRMLESKKDTLRGESSAVAKEIESLRNENEDIAKLMADTGYDTIEFSQIVNDAAATDRCLQAMNLTVKVIDEKLDRLGVAKLKEEIASLKGTTTTVTKENEKGETITETVTVGGLIPEAQKKKAELQKKCDDLQAKLDELDAYLDKNNGKITAMFNRLESEQKANSVFDKMAAITAYVKENPKNNMFMQDTNDKLGSFPGESKEEDDILFIMKVESETGIRMQMVNYGQDYQHKQLSNGMLLCYEVYSIPYYASYEGLKNLIAYFNDNDDFYASVYTLSIQYNPTNQSIQGNMIILHYYLLDENAEYVPPVIDEEIIPGIDGIFGDMTDNNKPTQGKQSPYTVDDIKGWLDDGMTFEQIRDKLKSEGYPATEFAWIMKDEYKTPSDMQGFLEEYGEEGVEYDLDYVLDLLECDLKTLMDIYYYTDEPEDTTESTKPEDPEEDTTGDNTPNDPEEDTTGGNTPDDPEEDTTGGNTPDDPEEDTTGGNTSGNPEQGTSGGNQKPNNPEQGTTDGNDKPQTGKQSDYTAEQIEAMLVPTGTKSLEQVRDMLKKQGYPATELAWILKEKYTTRDEIEMFVLFRGEGKYTTLEDATELFECTEDELRAIYNY